MVEILYQFLATAPALAIVVLMIVVVSKPDVSWKSDQAEKYATKLSVRSEENPDNVVSIHQAHHELEAAD